MAILRGPEMCPANPVLSGIKGHNTKENYLAGKPRRSGVELHNSQPSTENSGKMLIALFEPVEKTHNPSQQLRRLVDQKRLSNTFKTEIDEIISILEHFGIEEHFMTDYGDEATRTDPWSLFDEDDAREAFGMAERCYGLAEQIFLEYTK